MSALKAEYVEALSLLAEACGEVERKGYPRPILVGGAAVEFHTGGDITSNDFDFVTPAHEAFEQVLPKYGFIETEHTSLLLKSFRHPDLDISAEVLSEVLYQGSDITRVRLVDLGNGKRMAISPIEDLIADRLGQYAEDGRESMLGQALALYQLAYEKDEPYLDRRIREQTSGDWTLERLRGRAL
jgi:hypothetical protein